MTSCLQSSLALTIMAFKEKVFLEPNGLLLVYASTVFFHLSLKGSFSKSGCLPDTVRAITASSYSIISQSPNSSSSDSKLWLSAYSISSTSDNFVSYYSSFFCSSSKTFENSSALTPDCLGLYSFCSSNPFS